MDASSFSRRTPGHAYDFLPPERTARQPRAGTHVSDVSDAEFVVIGGRSHSQAFNARSFNDNRKRAPAPEPQPAIAAKPLLRGLRVLEEWLQQASFKSFTALVFLLFVLVFGLSGGFSGLQPDAQAGALPLHFTHVTLTPRDANGMRILALNGILENESGTTQIVRPIRADLMADGRLTASIVINPPVDVIYSGESRGFSARVQHAGGKMPEVRLSFMP